MTCTPTQWPQTHQQLNQNRQQTFSDISVKALPVFAALSGVSLQGLQPCGILLCKTGLDRVVKQPWQCKNSLLPISKALINEVLLGKNWILLHSYLKIFSSTPVFPSRIRYGMWREYFKRMGWWWKIQTCKNMAVCKKKILNKPLRESLPP